MCLGVCIRARACLWCVWDWDCLYLERGVCTRTDRGGNRIKEDEENPSRSPIHAAIVLKSQIHKRCRVVLWASERFAYAVAQFFTKSDESLWTQEKENKLFCVCDCIFSLIKMDAQNDNCHFGDGWWWISFFFSLKNTTRDYLKKWARAEAISDMFPHHMTYIFFSISQSKIHFNIAIA